MILTCFCMHRGFTVSLRGPQLKPFHSEELQVSAPRLCALHQSITVTAWILRVTPGFLGYSGGV